MSAMASCLVVLPIAAALLALKATIPARPDTRYRCSVWYLDVIPDDPDDLAFPGTPAESTEAHQPLVH